MAFMPLSLVLGYIEDDSYPSVDPRSNSSLRTKPVPQPRFEGVHSRRGTLACIPFPAIELVQRPMLQPEYLLSSRIDQAGG
jgi:hypothetical protein